MNANSVASVSVEGGVLRLHERVHTGENLINANSVTSFLVKQET